MKDYMKFTKVLKKITEKAVTIFYQNSAAAFKLYKNFEVIFGQSKCLAIDSSAFQSGKIFGLLEYVQKPIALPVFKIQHCAYTLNGACIVLNDFVMLENVNHFKCQL